MKNLKNLAATIATLFCCIAANAQTFEVDGLTYSVTSSTNRTVSVKKSSTEPTGDIVIPATVTYNDNEYRVTSLAYEAFRKCNSLASIYIPEGVTSFGNFAFESCGSLVSITIPKSVTSIGANAFQSCSNLTDIHLGSIESWLKIEFDKNYVAGSHPNYLYSGKNVNLYIDGELLTAIEIPASVTSIPSFSFYNCTSITSVTIPESVTSIGLSAFYNCSSLTSVTIREGVTSIGSNAFYNCSSLTSITIPESVTSIDNCAFYGCINLTDIHLSDIESWLKINYVGDNARPNYVGKNAKLYIDDELLTVVEIPATVTSIPSYSFYNCTNITSVTIPESVTSIGSSAFSGCSGLTSITIPESVTSIGSSAFSGCSSLSSITIPESVTLIDGYTFWNCSSLTSVTIPESVTSIGSNAFYNCSSLTSITIPESVTSIGVGALEGSVKEIILKPITPPTLTSTVGNDYVVIAVPKEAYSDYCAAPYWSNRLGNITIDDEDVRVKNLTLKASDDKSSLLAALGEENIKFVTDLTISGSINSYDFMLMRNQMPLLRHLNLKDASIVYNAHEHYTGYHTEDDQFPGYGLSNCKLLSFVFPENIVSVGTYSVGGNKYLSEVVLFEGISSIGNSAFKDCNALTEITLPEGVTSIGIYAFQNCGNLANITLPKGVETVENYAFDKCVKLASVTFLDGLISIGSKAFNNCYALEKVVLPPTVKTIDGYAFQNCNKLKEIRIPSSVRTVGNYAFSGCTSLNDVYVYTVEPFNIGQNTFAKSGNQFIGTLHAPKVSYWTYYYNTQWNQFANRAEFDEPYENFYLVGDKELDSTTGAIEGEGDKNPDAEMGNNSGLIVEDDIVQDLGNVDIEHNGTDGGSIVVSGPDGCVNTGELHFHIRVQGGRWYFFCFPFDVRREDIKTKGWADWVFRYYDGEERAKNGKGGWKNVTSDGNGNFLKAATGYIFQASREDVLIISAKNQKIKHEDKYNELVAHVTENMHDASWNFVGNPYLSYYEVTSEDYSAPITVWDGSKYIAIRPGDDDYQLAPFEGFFVQKPEDTYAVTYSADRQMTYNQAQESAAQARARRRAMPINPDRLLVNITLSNGEDTDQTRVVFNNNAAMGYETTCDAAKFETAGVPQLYTVDSRAVKYAINERPMAEGIVTVGYTAPAQGSYTLAAPRMDTPICIKDNLTGTIHDFSEGSYTFMTEEGTFEDRFTMMMKAGETSIDNGQLTIDNEAPTYNTKGQRVENTTEQGVYIKNNRKVVTL